MRFSEAFIQEVLDRTDMEELVGRYVELKRSGSDLMGRCPFHSEKTPSFTVSPQKKLFYCFGCQAGGSAITFVQKTENLDFADAVGFLAARAGLQLPREPQAGTEPEGVSRSRVLEMNLEAAKFFRACLFDEQIGRAGRAYFLENRKLSMATVKHFGLGYAPDSFHLLTDHMHRLGYRDEELFAACLCAKSQKTGRGYDYFRNRVIFPIIDPSGNVVAFGGRVMDDSKPKYLNSSDTPAFKKSRHLFALNFAKNSCAEQMILCEGYMDVIALHAAGFEQAVATLGTSMTPEHARIFSKYTKRVVISYDADAAGQNAANKAMRLLGEVGMEVRVLKLDGAKDPDEFLRKFGADRFRHVLAQSKTGFDYKSEQILSGYTLTEGADKIKAAKALCELIAEYYSPIEREIYISRMAERLELPKDVLHSSVEQVLRHRRKTLRQRESREAQATLQHFGDRINPQSAALPGIAKAEENVLGLLLLFEEYRNETVGEVGLLSEDDFATDFHRRVFQTIMELHRKELGFRFELLGEIFSPDELGRIRKMEVERQRLPNNGPEAFRTAVQALREKRQLEQAKQGDVNDFVTFLRQKSKRKNT